MHWVSRLSKCVKFWARSWKNILVPRSCHVKRCGLVSIGV